MSISEQVAVNLSDIVTGGSAESAEKSVIGANVSQDSKAVVYRCILSGAQRPSEMAWQLSSTGFLRSRIRGCAYPDKIARISSFGRGSAPGYAGSLR
jgi:hypothetical protein